MENNIYIEKIKKADQGDERIIFASLLSSVLKISYHEARNFSGTLSSAEKEELSSKIDAFLGGTPYQYLTNEAAFFGRDFYVDEGTLIPRNDTEILVEKALTFIKNGDKVLDLCCGSGCIGLTLAAEKNTETLLCDFSKKAIEATQKNIEKLALKGCKALLHDVLTDKLEEEFRLIVSNPPYIPAEDIKTLSAYVKKEPISALDGGEDGLDFYRVISKKYYKNLLLGGAILFEVGIGQAEDVLHILEEGGYGNVGTAKDYGGIYRIVWGYKE